MIPEGGPLPAHIPITIFGPDATICGAPLLCGNCKLHGDVFPFDEGDPDSNPGNCVVDIDDLIVILAAFAVSPDPCPDLPDTVNLFPCGQACEDGVADIDEVTSILSAFAGNYDCPHQCYPGACCFGDGTCSDGVNGGANSCPGGMSHSNCVALGGTYMGNETTCADQTECPGGQGPCGGGGASALSGVGPQGGFVEGRLGGP